MPSESCLPPPRLAHDNPFPTSPVSRQSVRQKSGNLCLGLIFVHSIPFSPTVKRPLLSIVTLTGRNLTSILLCGLLVFLGGCSSIPDIGTYTDSLGSATKAIPEFGRRSLDSVARSVPELGMLTDQGTAGRGIMIRLSDQKAFLYKHGELVAVSPASTGREGYNTPTGRHRVIAKDIDHRSSLYGAYERDGRVVVAGVDVRKDRKPPGAVFVGAPMPYYLQIAPSYGLHSGHVPGYPASHGCIRLPNRWAKRFYYAVKVGTPVWISR